MNGTISVGKSASAHDILKHVRDLSHVQVYVGIPEDTTDRKKRLHERAKKLKPTKAGKLSKGAKKLLDAARGDVTNAELMFIHTNGSPLRHIPARPVIEPAIEEQGNREKIAQELGAAAQATMEQTNPVQNMVKHLNRAGLTAQNAVRGWFTDPKNGWPPNAPRTIARKGSDQPLIDTAELRKAVTYVIAESAGIQK